MTRPQVTTDGDGLTSRAGLGLLGEVADRSGLTGGLSWAMSSCGIDWHTHDPGLVLTHLAIAIADGADCLSDLAVLRDQPELFPVVASQTTAWRAVNRVTSVEARRIPQAVADAREVVWDAAGFAPGSLTLDFDATLVTSHSEKQDAAPTYKRGYGFAPFGVFCDDTDEMLAAMLRPGNAGPNNAGDHVMLLEDALAGLPARYQAGHGWGDDPGEVAVPLLVRADSAGASHWFTEELGDRNIEYSIGFPVSGAVRDGLILCQEEDWEPAVETSGNQRPGAEVIELTALVNLSAWDDGTRLICRRERPHPGAQLSLFDTGQGWRHTCFITNNADSGDIAALELRHRGHARVEDRIRAWKATGLANLPFHGMVPNQAWIAVSLLASCLLAWMRLTCLDGPLAKAEPKTLRQRLFHVAARIVRPAGRLTMRIDSTWPWATQLAHAYQQLRHALPGP